MSFKQLIRIVDYILPPIMYVVLLAPVGIFVLYAFSTRWFYPAVLPDTWTLEPFLDQLTDEQTREALWASIQIAFLVSIMSLVIGYPAARVLGLRRFPGKTLVYLFLFLPTVVPPIATGIGLNIMLLRLGLARTTIGVALVHLVPVLPYMVFTLASVFARYDPTFEKQALVLGASHWRIFWSVTLPLILPGVVVSVLFAFLISWSQYLLTLLVGGGQVITLPVLLFSTVSGGNPTTISVQALLFVILPIAGIIAVSRYLSVGSSLTRV